MFQKIFNGYIFYFLGQLFGGQLFELFAREANLKKQSSVYHLQMMLLYITNNLPPASVFPMHLDASELQLPSLQTLQSA